MLFVSYRLAVTFVTAFFYTWMYLCRDKTAQAVLDNANGVGPKG